MKMNTTEMAEKLVRDSVLMNMSYWVDVLRIFASNADRPTCQAACVDLDDDIYPLMERVDYEGAGIDAINDADADTLENMCGHVGWFEDAAALSGYDPDKKYLYHNETEARELYAIEWFFLQDEGTVEYTEVRAYIRANCSDWETFCQDFDVDTDDFKSDVYEHWAVTDWLGRRLAAKGECVGEVCGTTVWGRCTTGQSISMDGVIEQIAKEINQ
jgi:hypothetical protein